MVSVVQRTSFSQVQFHKMKFRFIHLVFILLPGIQCWPNIFAPLWRLIERFSGTKVSKVKELPNIAQIFLHENTYLKLEFALIFYKVRLLREID